MLLDKVQESKKATHKIQLRALMEEVCHETCLEPSDFDSQNIGLLSKMSMEDARQMLEAVKIRLSKVQPRSKNRAAFLYSVLTSAKTQLKRHNDIIKSHPGAQGNGSNGSPSMSPSLSPSTPTNGGIDLRDIFSLSEDGLSKKDSQASVQPVVRKAIGELCNWTCFDKSDLAAPEIVALLNSMPSATAVSVLKTVEKRMMKVKRKNIGNAGAFLLGALQTAASQQGRSNGASGGTAYGGEGSDDEDDSDSDA